MTRALPPVKLTERQADTLSDLLQKRVTLWVFRNAKSLGKDPGGIFMGDTLNRVRLDTRQMTAVLDLLLKQNDTELLALGFEVR